MSKSKRHQFFITLSHIELRGVSIEDIKIRLLEYGFRTVIGVEESHSGRGTHFHFILIHGSGISKHSYVKELREVFKEFEGMQFDVSGIKNIKAAITYLLKDQMNFDSVLIHGISQEEILKKANLENLRIYFRMGGFSLFSEWQKNRLCNLNAFFANPRKVQII